MEIKTGVDIIEVSRIQDSIEKLGEDFINKIFTKSEIEYCKDTKKMMYQHYSARFAVKEATFKAVSELLEDKYSINWQNVETIIEKSGKPKINFIGLSKDVENSLNRIKSIDVSISHIQELAIANVVILVD